MPRVSVIVPCYNTGKYLRQALDSVLAQTYQDWEIILVDDGSTDNSAEVAAQAKPMFGDRLKYVHQSNRGLPAARNTAVQNSSGEFISFLDADDVYVPTRLQRGIEVMDAHPNVGLVHSRVDRIDMSGAFLEHPHAPDPKYLSGNIAKFIFNRRAHIQCPTILFRRSCLLKAGSSDESLAVNADRDICFKIALHYPVLYIDEILAHYRISPTAMSRNLDRMRAGALQFIEKHQTAGTAKSRWVREALANLYREWGDDMFRCGEHKKALGWYAKSVAKFPWNKRNVYMLFRAIAEPVVALIRPMPTAIKP